MHSWLLLWVSLFACTTAVHAVVINVTGAANTTNPGDQGSSDVGTLSLATAIPNSTPSPSNLVYTISDLDVDGSGGSNDSVVVELIVSTDGQLIKTGGGGYLSSGTATMNASGEFVMWSFSNLTVNLNGGTNNGSGSFLGFTGIQMGAWNDPADVALINGVTHTYAATGETLPVTGGGMFAKAEWFAGDWRVSAVDFRISPDSSAPNLPTIPLFTATPAEIDPGDSVTLAWSTTDADTLTLQPGIGDVTGLTSTQIVLNTATTYSLIAQNADGSVTSSVSVSLLLYPPSILSFTAIDLGSTIELVWESTGADALTINQGVGDVTGLTSTQVVDAAVSSYTLTATNSDGSVSAKANVHALPATNSPNVVFVLVDDWGWTDHSSTNAAQGNQSLYFQTPNFNRLADSGIALTSTYTQPNCAPTRAALISGQYSCRVGNGVYNVTTLNRSGTNTTYTTAADQGDEHVNGDEQTITIGEAFINSGYVTAHFGKYHAGDSDPNHPTHPLNQGYDFNYGGQNDGNPGSFHALDTTPRTFHEKVGPELDAFAEDYDLPYITNNLLPFASGNDPTTLVGTKKHLTDAMADAFESFMNNHRSGSLSNYPVYAQFHYYAVHSPIQPRADLEAKYLAITPPAESTHNNARYAALIEGMDHTLGRIVAYLDDPDGDGNSSDSIADNTLIIFLSDNGGWSTVTTDNAPLRDFKGSHFEGGIRVPCVVRMPGTIPTNKVSDTLVHCVDFYPTMLDFAGGVYPNATTHPLDGVSLYEHLLDPDGTARNREPIFFHFPGYLDTRAYASSAAIKEVNGKRFKYIYSYDPYYGPSAANDQYQLYNLTDDISETVNLLDYIDLENAADPGDPSTPEEVWNYILYKELGDELSSDLRTWLIGDTNDVTWQPIHVTYKDTYPGIDPGQVGQPVDLPPTNIPTLVIPAGQQFRVLDLSETGGVGEFAVVFNSATGFTFSVQASSNLVHWVDLTNGLPGQSSSTTNLVYDPSFATETLRFYRAGVTDD